MHFLSFRAILLLVLYERDNFLLSSKKFFQAPTFLFAFECAKRRLLNRNFEKTRDDWKRPRFCTHISTTYDKESTQPWRKENSIKLTRPYSRVIEFIRWEKWFSWVVIKNYSVLRKPKTTLCIDEIRKCHSYTTASK